MKKLVQNFAQGFVNWFLGLRKTVFLGLRKGRSFC